MAGHVYIGTSGWHYRHWRGPFYPLDLPPRDWLPFYARHLRCVELNSSFYHLPPASRFGNWFDRTPADFRFAVKAWRQITHRRRLLDCAEPLDTFLEHARTLRHKLGPILFQLPPGFHCDPARLRDFLTRLPEPHRYAFEFRHPSWHQTAVYDLLSAHGAAFCIFELAGYQSPLMATADFVYVRLHGPAGAYQGSYDAATLARWADRLCAWQAQGHDVFLFFDNDEAGYAVRNAMDLQASREWDDRHTGGANHAGLECGRQSARA